MIVEQLRASVGALSAERMRLESELMELERKANAMANTNGTDDNLVRELKKRIDAKEAELAAEREVLARAEQQNKTLARDRAAARAAEHQAAIDATKANLQAEVAAYLSDYAQLVRSLRTLTTTIPTLESRMREVAVLSRSLTPNGKAPIICDATAYEKRLAWLVMHFLKRMPNR